MIANGRLQRGFSIIDVLIGAALLAVVSMIAITHLNSEWRQAESNRDRVFAYERAQSMIDELRAFAATSEVSEAAELDQWDDGTGFRFPLTILRRRAPNEDQFVLPDSPVSANQSNNGVWRFSRRITVRHFPGLETRDLRIVTVRVYKHDPDDLPGTELATISTVIRTTADATPPTQVFDVYLLAIENVPGWWVYMDTIKPFIEASLGDLASRNPGLEFRAHWVTKLGYGRNPQYTPYINDANDSVAATDYVYFYPGTMPTGSSAQRYYVADNMRARISVDGNIRNTYDATANPHPYTLADQYNHCVRYPEAEKLFADRVADGQEDAGTPSWRLLLERMNTNPAEYRNAIFVNLHGELLPMPPMRNFSDAARAPVRLPGVRVVTHPEQLHFERDPADTNTEDVRLRVYSYKTDPDAGAEMLAEPIVIEIPGIDLTANVNGTASSRTLEIRHVPGGLDLNPVDGDRDAYVDPTSAAGLCPIVLDDASFTLAYPGEMYARVRYVAAAAGNPAATVIELHNSPTTCRSVSSRGLPSTRRLYGLEYIPCSTESANDFSDNLYTSASREKNTARWLIRLPKAALGSNDRQLEFVTRIGLGDGGDTDVDGAAFRTGVMYPPVARNEPENISRTYCWWTDNTNDVPMTERYQFQGDPRHSPYLDNKDTSSPFSNGYNWYFDDFNSGSDNAESRWPGFEPGRIRDKWQGRLEVDVPRMLQVLRNGLTESESLWTTLTGFSYYYMGIGNEIGYDSANGFPSSIPVNGEPFGATGDGFEQSITGSGGSYGSGVKYIRSSAGGDYWWSMSWLGELCPDDAYDANWRVPRFEYVDALPLPGTLPRSRGNLPAGSGSSDFMRERRGDISTTRMPYGTDLSNAEHRTEEEGSTSVFNIGSSSSTFHHKHADGSWGNLSTDGNELATSFHFPLPRRAKVSRPWSISSDSDGGVGDEFSYSSEFPRFSAAIRKTYYEHDSSGVTGSALVELANPGATKRAYVLVSGIDRTTESGSGFIARYGMLSLLHGFLSAGDPGLPDPVTMPPRLTIQAPTAVTELLDPTTLTLQWRTEDLRWDGNRYAQSYPTTFSQPQTDIEYVLLYSRDNGSTWLHIEDETAATPGVLPGSMALRRADVNQSGAGDESFAWSVPDSDFPEGTYRVRIEAYRTGARLHYSFHEEQIFIDR